MITEPVNFHKRLVRIVSLLAGIALISIGLSSNAAIASEHTDIGPAQMLIIGFGLLTAFMACFPPQITGPYLMILISITATLAASEFIVRSVVGPRYATPFTYDEELIFKLKPGATRIFKHTPENGGSDVEYHINERGFRGPELLLEEYRPRVVIYGDSFIHAEFTPLQETFAFQLQKQLAVNAQPGPEVINAGVAGYGPDQIALKMERELGWLKPKLAIVSLFSGNDFGDLLRNKLYKLDENGFLQKNKITIGAGQLNRMRISENEPILRKVFRDARKRLLQEKPSQAFNRLNMVDLSLAIHLEEYESYIVRKDNTVGAFAVDPYSSDIAVLPESPSALYKIQLMSRIVERIKTIAAAHNTPIIIMIVPHPMDLLDGDHDSGWVDKLKYPNYSATRLSKLMEDIARSNKLTHINLFPFFRAANPQALYLKGGDDHWNSLGQKLAASIVAAIITQGNYLK